MARQETPAPTPLTEGVETWSEQTFRALRDCNVRQIAYLPDGALSVLIRQCRDDPAMEATALTTEEEGVMLAAGAWLGGERSAVLIQCGGVGNCVNMFSLLSACTIPCVFIVAMRGVWGEFNPWQIPMGKATRSCFELFGFSVLDIDDAATAGGVIRAACQLAYGGGARVAVLVSQRMLGAKTFEE